MPSETHFYTLNSHVKRGASSRWSFVPNSVWGSIGTTTIGKAHPTVIFRFLFWMKLMLWLTLKVIKIKRLGFIEHWTKKNVNFYFFRPLMMTKLWSLQKKLSHIQIQLNSNEKKKLFPTLNNIRSVSKFLWKKKWFLIKMKKLGNIQSYSLHLKTVLILVLKIRPGRE